MHMPIHKFSSQFGKKYVHVIWKMQTLYFFSIFEILNLIIYFSQQFNGVFGA